MAYSKAHEKVKIRMIFKNLDYIILGNCLETFEVFMKVSKNSSKA